MMRDTGIKALRRFPAFQLIAGMGALFIGVSVAQSAFITTPQTFETFTQDPVDGQGNWTVHTFPSVGSADVLSKSGGDAAADVYEGDKSLRIKDINTGGTPFVYYKGTNSASGSFSFIAKTGSDLTGSMYLSFQALDTDSSSIGAIGFDQATGKFRILSSATPLGDVPTYAPGRWYRFDVNFDKDAGDKGQYTISIYDTTTGQKIYSHAGTSFSNKADIGQITIRGSNANTGTLYIDNLTSVPEPAAGAVLCLGGLLLLRRRKQAA